MDSQLIGIELNSDERTTQIRTIKIKLVIELAIRAKGDDENEE